MRDHAIVDELKSPTGSDTSGDDVAQALGRRRLKQILALTAPVADALLTRYRAELRAAALAVRATLRGPSKLGRRLRRKHELGLAGRL